MVVSGLGLLLGARADAALRAHRRAAAPWSRARSTSTGDPRCAARAADAGGDVTDGLILARTVSAEGRSRAHVGGRTAPVSVLSELGEMLVAVHGQADQWRLRQPEQHREVLDRFAGAAVRDRPGRLRRALRRVPPRWPRGRPAAARWPATGPGRSTCCAPGLEEIEAVDPQPGEDLELRAEDERLAHADGLRASAAQAHASSPATTTGSAAGAGGGRPSSWPRRAPRSARMAEHDPALRDLARRLAELGYLAADLGGRPGGVPGRRRGRPGPAGLGPATPGRAGRAARKYGDTIDDVLAWAKESAARLAELEGADDRAAELEARLEPLRGELAASAATLSAARRKAAVTFGQAGDHRAGPPGHGQGRWCRPRWPPPRRPRGAACCRRTEPRAVRPGTASTTSRSLLRRQSRRPGAHASPRRRPAASCPGSCSPSRWCWPAPTRCRRSSSTRSTPASAAGPPSSRRAGWPRWPDARR